MRLVFLARTGQFRRRTPSIVQPTGFGPWADSRQSLACLAPAFLPQGRTSGRSRWAELAVVALLLSAVACQRASEPPEVSGPASRPVVLGGPTLEAEWTDLARLEQRIAAERGRVVVVNFWATWCEPCREEFPDFIELQRRHASRGLLVLAVSLDAPSERDTEVKKFLAEMQPVFPVLIKTAGDPDVFINAIDPKWTGSLPATLIYDRSGKRRQAFFVPQTLASLEGYTEPLLAAR